MNDRVPHIIYLMYDDGLRLKTEDLARLRPPPDCALTDDDIISLFSNPLRRRDQRGGLSNTVKKHK